MQHRHAAYLGALLLTGAGLLALLLLEAPAAVLALCAGVAAAVLAVLTRRWDQFAVITVIAVVPLAGSMPILAWAAGLPMMAGALAVVAQTPARVRPRVHVDPVVVLLLLLLCLHSLLAYAAAGDRSGLAPLLLGGGLLVLVGCTWIHLRAASNVVRVVDALAVATTVVAAAYLVYAVPRTRSVATWTGVYEDWSWVNPNTLAAVLAMGFAGSLGALVAGFGRAHLITVAVTLAALLLTFSRSAYVAALVVVIVVMLLRLRRVWVLLPLAVATLLWVPQAVRQRVLYTTSSGTLDSSSATRLELWRLALDGFLARPLTGHGLHAISPLIAEAHGRVGLAFFHNTYLTVLVAFGLPLFLASAALLVRSTARLTTDTARSAARTPQLLVVTVAIVTSFFGEPYAHPTTATLLAAILLSRPTDWTSHAISDPARLRHGGGRVVAVRPGR